MLKSILNPFKTARRTKICWYSYTLATALSVFSQFFCGVCRANHVTPLDRPHCEAGGMSRLNKMASEGHITSVIFFASWCPSCREHLVHSNPKKDLLIATFDEKKQAEKALVALNTSTPCLLDDGIAKELKILDVPFTLNVIDGKIQPSLPKK